VQESAVPSHTPLSWLGYEAWPKGTMGVSAWQITTVEYLIYGLRTSLGDKPDGPNTGSRVSSAGPTTCLHCEPTFRSGDRRYHRLCPRCRPLLSTQPSDAGRQAVLTRWRLTPDDSAAAAHPAAAVSGLEPST
jgi:hypothetical protein